MAAKVSEMILDLRTKHCSVDSSKLINEILSIFFKRHASKEAKVLEELFFNRKAFIREALASAESDADLEEVLKEALKKVGVSKKKKSIKPNDGSRC